MRINIILLSISILLLVKSFYIQRNLSEYKKEKNVEVVVLNKTQSRVPGEKNSIGGVDSYLIVQALNEVKGDVVNIKDHSFIRNIKNIDENGSIKSKFITKTYINGPIFEIKVDLETYIIQSVGTRLVYKLSNRDMSKDESVEDIIKLFIVLTSLGITLLIISILRILLWR